MARRSWLVFSLALLTIGLHLLPRLGVRGLFGLDALAYLPRAFSLAWCLAAALLLLPPLARRLLPDDSSAPPRPAGGVVAVILSLVLFPILTTATPLLGDGLDRIEGLTQGWKALRGQPAPLDLALHLLGLRWLGPRLAFTAFDQARQTYRLVSCLAGGLAVFAAWQWARRRSRSAWDQALLFGGLLGLGATLLFCGYPENYSVLAAVLFAHLWLLDRALQPGRSPLPPLLSLLGLIGLHFFSVLLLPPTFYALFRAGRWRPGPAVWAALLAVGAAFLAFLLLMLERHYRGAAAIFLAPAQIFSPARLLEFLNEQLLVCPALLLLLPLALSSGRRFSTCDPITSYLAPASLIWLPFFYALRPVLGAGPDWDLFSLPALIYTPWLLLRAKDRISSEPQARYLVWAVLVVSFFHTIPWIAVNARPEAAVARYENLILDLEAKNPWAAGYGWLKLGKYWQRLGRTEPALSAYERSLAANPGYSVLYREVGEKMIELGRLDLAVPRFEGFLLHNPTNPGAKPALARARRLYAQQLEWQGRFPEAAAQYQAILELDPDQAEAQTALDRLRGKTAAGTRR
jgi:tetratricopeptide (TPR) repeat protein